MAILLSTILRYVPFVAMRLKMPRNYIHVLVDISTIQPVGWNTRIASHLPKSLRVRHVKSKLIYNHNKSKINSTMFQSRFSDAKFMIIVCLAFFCAGLLCMMTHTPDTPDSLSTYDKVAWLWCCSGVAALLSLLPEGNHNTLYHRHLG